MQSPYEITGWQPIIKKPIPVRLKYPKLKVVSNTLPPIKAQYEKQNYCCFYCTTPIPFKHITHDHFIPKSKGGKHFNNMVLACKFCNGEKCNLSIDRFKSKIENHIRKGLEFQRGKDFVTIKRLQNIVATCNKIINKEIEVEFVKYGT